MSSSSARFVRWRDETREQADLAFHIVRWIVLGALSGALAGLASYVFLEGLDRITNVRLRNGWLLYLLPVAGLVIGAGYHYLAGRAARGNDLLIDEIHEPTGWVPRRMAPLVLLGTWATHLFGGSAGREGVALQMSGSLSDSAARALRLSEEDRRLMLIGAIAGGFGGVFGVPLAGAVFALEVQAVGRVRYEALVPALTSSLVADLVVHGLGYEHRPYPQFDVPLDGLLLLKIAAAGLAFGLTGALFAELTHGLKRLMARLVGWPPLRTALGGTAVVGLALLFGSDYLGLSLPLITAGLAGEHVAAYAFALKMLFTVVTLGSGFPGGEVTPLFVIGTTLGATLAGPLGVDPVLLAAIGFTAVFAGAANTPLACTIMGVELFSSGAVMPFAVGCVIAYVFSSHRGIYSTQRIHASKGRTPIAGAPTIHHWGQRRAEHRGQADRG